MCAVEKCLSSLILIVLIKFVCPCVFAITYLAGITVYFRTNQIGPMGMIVAFASGIATFRMCYFCCRVVVVYVVRDKLRIRGLCYEKTFMKSDLRLLRIRLRHGIPWAILEIACQVNGLQSYETILIPPIFTRKPESFDLADLPLSKIVIG